MDIFERVEKLNLPLGEYAVFGSALLDVWGLRKANDLDLVVTPELFAQLRRDGWVERPGNGFEIISKDGADATTVQNQPTDGDYCPDRMQLIKDAEIINGIPFVRIEEVIACKRAYNRPKDIEDIKMIEHYLIHQSKEME